MRDKATPSLPEVPAHAFKHVLGFLYEGSCEPERRLLPELLRAANYLGVEPLKQATLAACGNSRSPSLQQAALSLPWALWTLFKGRRVRWSCSRAYRLLSHAVLFLNDTQCLNVATS